MPDRIDTLPQERALLEQVLVVDDLAATVDAVLPHAAIPPMAAGLALVAALDRRVAASTRLLAGGGAASQVQRHDHHECADREQPGA